VSKRPLFLLYHGRLLAHCGEYRQAAGAFAERLNVMREQGATAAFGAPATNQSTRQCSTKIAGQYRNESDRITM
jgi:hypothetical protein